MKITKQYLKAHLNHIFVFGDNLLREGYGGAAKLRAISNTYGFITKKRPNNLDSSFYKPDEYYNVFEEELIQLKYYIGTHPTKTFLISKLGSGLANKYRIYEEVIEPRLGELSAYSNVRLLFDMGSKKMKND